MAKIEIVIISRDEGMWRKRKRVCLEKGDGRGGKTARQPDKWRHMSGRPRHRSTDTGSGMLTRGSQPAGVPFRERHARWAKQHAPLEFWRYRGKMARGGDVPLYRYRLLVQFGLDIWLGSRDPIGKSSGWLRCIVADFISINWWPQVAN